MTNRGKAEKVLTALCRKDPSRLRGPVRHCFTFNPDINRGLTWAAGWISPAAHVRPFCYQRPGDRCQRLLEIDL